MSTPTEDLQGSLALMNQEWALPAMYYENYSYAVSSESRLTKGLTVTLGGKVEDITLSIIVSKAVLTGGKTGDSTFYPDVPLTGDRNMPPPNVGRIVQYKNVNYRIGDVIQISEVAWHIDLVSLNTKGHGG